MGVVLTLKKPLDTLLDLEPLSAHVSAGIWEISDTPLRYGRGRISAGELFCVRETEQTGLTLCGDIHLAINVGAGMRNGRITAESTVGAGAGARMAGGELIIAGDAGKKACFEMQNGFVQIFGVAGDGFAYGVRRGTLILYGRAEGEACVDFRGGTALLLGGVGDAENLADGMSRGTVLLPKGTAAPGGFLRAANGDFVFLRLLFAVLGQRGVSLPEGWPGGVFTCWVGDAAGLGKGEIFIPMEERV
jgi:formylmethanofuran dehydrogenase subunit C